MAHKHIDSRIEDSATSGEQKLLKVSRQLADTISKTKQVTDETTNKAMGDMFDRLSSLIGGIEGRSQRSLDQVCARVAHLEQVIALLTDPD